MIYIKGYSVEPDLAEQTKHALLLACLNIFISNVQKISGIQVFGETKAKNVKNAADRVFVWEVKG